MKRIVFIVLTGFNLIGYCQSDSTTQRISNSPNPVVFNGYVEGYYSYDFNTPENNTKPRFLFNHNRHNEFNINLAFLRGSYLGDKVRGTMAIGIGTYMNANYSAEPGTLKNIYEANAGFKIGKKNLWVDVGVLPSHIGFESAVSKDCWNLTRSLLAENTPFYESGARITSISGNTKWVLSLLLLNGWQRITRPDGYSMLCYGAQIQYKPNSATTFNYSSFIGTDKPDSARLIRIYHNLYAIFQLSKSVGIITGFDFGTEQKIKGSSKVNVLYSPVIITKYAINDHWALGVRGEYYCDRNGILIPTSTPNGFKTVGLSANLDYAQANNLVFRFEGRLLDSKDNIFAKAGNSKNNDAFVTTSVAISF